MKKKDQSLQLLQSEFKKTSYKICSQQSSFKQSRKMIIYSYSRRNCYYLLAGSLGSGQHLSEEHLAT